MRLTICNAFKSFVNVVLY